MNDYDSFINLCEKNNISYRTTKIYDENNNAYPCVWLKVGHVEFGNDKIIKNIVTY